MKNELVFGIDKTLNNESTFDLSNVYPKWNREVMNALEDIKKEEIMKMVRKKMEHPKV